MDAVTQVGSWVVSSELVTLPSGNVARLSKPDPFMMMATEEGRIPNALASAVSKFLNSGSPAADQRLEVEEIQAFVNLINRVCVAAFIEPKVNVAGDLGALPLSRLSFEDKMAVFRHALGGAQLDAAQSFPGPEKQGGGL